LNSVSLFHPFTLNKFRDRKDSTLAAFQSSIFNPSPLQFSCPCPTPFPLLQAKTPYAFSDSFFIEVNSWTTSGTHLLSFRSQDERRMILNRNLKPFPILVYCERRNELVAKTQPQPFSWEKKMKDSFDRTTSITFLNSNTGVSVFFLLTYLLLHLFLIELGKLLHRTVSQFHFLHLLWVYSLSLKGDSGRRRERIDCKEREITNSPSTIFIPGLLRLYSLFIRVYGTCFLSCSGSSFTDLDPLPFTNCKQTLLIHSRSLNHLSLIELKDKVKLNHLSVEQLRSITNQIALFYSKVRKSRLYRFMRVYS